MREEMAEVRKSLLVHRICKKQQQKITQRAKEYFEKQASSEIYIRVRMTITKII